jgi:proteic killer suppression protein
MIRSIRHRGLRRLLARDDARGIDPRPLEKVRRVLSRLQQAETPDDTSLPGPALHPPAGDLKGF